MSPGIEEKISEGGGTKEFVFKRTKKKRMTYFDRKLQKKPEFIPSASMRNLHQMVNIALKPVVKRQIHLQKKKAREEQKQLDKEIIERKRKREATALQKKMYSDIMMLPVKLPLSGMKPVLHSRRYSHT